MNRFGAGSAAAHHLIRSAVECEGAVAVPHSRVTLHVPDAFCKVLGPSLRIAAPVAGTEAVTRPHAQRLVRIALPNDGFALLAIGCVAPATAVESH
eukprot:3017071-Prymnesium_polylepis.1